MGYYCPLDTDRITDTISSVYRPMVLTYEDLLHKRQSNIPGFTALASMHLLPMIITCRSNRHLSEVNRKWMCSGTQPAHSLESFDYVLVSVRAISSFYMLKCAQCA